jgi:aminoglycoside phosphotransferase (APT) family kinase protein
VKRRLERDRIEELLRTAGIEPGRVTAYSELPEGTYNTVYRIDLSDPSGELMLKVAPSEGTPGLTYEHQLIETETEFYQAALGKVPVPEVVHAGDDFLLMTALPGATMRTAGGRERYRRELGTLVAALHEVTGPGFGYPQRGLTARWGDAFLGMMDDLFADASRFGVALPEGATRQVVVERLDLLNSVDVPRLVHFDLWDGNILVDGERITGLIDGERAFWGDPVAEFVSLTLLQDDVDDDLLAGYGADVDRERLALYRVYLYLIMLIEGTPRGYEGESHEALMGAVRTHLATALTALLQRGS